MVFGKGDIGGIPVPELIFVATAIVLVWMLTQTRFGRNIFAVGGKRDAAVLAGIPAGRVEFIAYGLSGMLPPMAGILFASRMDGGQPSVGEGWLMGAITAAILDALRVCQFLLKPRTKHIRHHPIGLMTQQDLQKSD